MKRDLSREILHFYLGNKKMRVLKMDRPLAVGFVSLMGPSAPRGVVALCVLWAHKKNFQISQEAF